MALWDTCKTVFRFLAYASIFIIIPVKINKNVEPSSQLQLETKFANYVRQFNKSYSPEDYARRMSIFESALRKIESWNKRRILNESALYGLTEFTDLHFEEFAQHLGRKKHYNHSRRLHHHHHSASKRAIIPNVPLKVDWRTKGVVSDIKDQGTCGACWAFSTVSTIETMFAIKTGKLMELSVQEIIDCAQNGNLGCNGGDFCSLLEWLTTYNVTLGTAKLYPLVLQNNVCTWKKGNPGVLVAANFTCDYLVGNENAIIEMVARHGPVIVAVNAISWQYYLGGVIEHNCPGHPQLLNHAVEIVGYDLTAEIPHFIAKNSWGKHFGDNGYVKIATGANVCGIANEVSAVDVV